MNTTYFKKPLATKKVHPKHLWPIAVMGFLTLIAGCSLGADSGKDKLEVSSVYPLEGATNIGTSEIVSALFSDALKAETITTATFTLTANSIPVSGTVTYDAPNKTAQFAPDALLSPNTIYLATLTTAVKSNDGVALNKVKNWSFTTAEAGIVPESPDVIKPTVSSTLPLNNATAVNATDDITVTFSEAMLDSSISITSFTMTGYLGDSIPGAVSTLGSVATFNPTNTLSSGTVVTATVTTNVTDLAGNTLAVDKIWSFTTNNAGPAAVSLGMAGNYAILAKTGITNVPTSVITGNLGVSPEVLESITGFDMTNHEAVAGSGEIDYATAPEVVGGKIYAADLTGGTTAVDLTQATLDRGYAYTDAAGRTENAILNVGDGTIGGSAATTNFVSGLYTWGSAVHMTGDITLTGGASDVWIFQVAGTMTVDSAKQVTLVGGAQAKNVFWQITGETELGESSHFEGIILSASGITLITNATMNGRALSATLVALQKATLTQPAE